MALKRKLEEDDNEKSTAKKIKCIEKQSSVSPAIQKNKPKKIVSQENKESNVCEQQEYKPEVGKEATQTGKKSGRKRKKHFYNSIRQLMEFYLSDSNLRRDRFFGRLIKEDPYIPLDVFLKCNKLKELTQQPDDIVKALSNSTVLELNEEKNCVKRRIPFQGFDENVDQKILYVESLPVYADQDWVKNMFQRFGKVNYVSLPRYFRSQKLKGFGFIEFESEESIKKAMETFAKFNSVLLEMEDKPMELASFKNYFENEKNENETKESTEVHVEKSESKEQTAEHRKKRKTESNDEKVGISSQDKNVDSSKDKKVSVNVKSDKRAKDSDDNVESTMDVSSETDGTEDGSEQPKKKKSRKKSKISKCIQLERSENQLAADIIYYELKILPKVNWKRLRNMYLNLQRRKSSTIKLGYKKKLANSKTDATKEQLPQQEGEQSNEGGNCEEASKLQQQMNMNFYGAAQDGCVQLENPTNNNNCSAYKMESGLIVEVSFLEPCIETKDFKAEMRQNNSVKYIDVKEGDMKAQIRLESAEAALEFVQKTQCAEYRCSILSGEAELQYWNKIHSDRLAKLNKTTKIRNRRGREKVQTIIRNHVRFDDIDNGNEANINVHVW